MMLNAGDWGGGAEFEGLRCIFFPEYWSITQTLADVPSVSPHLKSGTNYLLASGIPTLYIHSYSVLKHSSHLILVNQRPHPRPPSDCPRLRFDVLFSTLCALQIIVLYCIVLYCIDSVMGTLWRSVRTWYCTWLFSLRQKAAYIPLLFSTQWNTWRRISLAVGDTQFTSLSYYCVE